MSDELVKRLRKRAAKTKKQVARARAMRAFARRGLEALAP